MPRVGQVLDGVGCCKLLGNNLLELFIVGASVVYDPLADGMAPWAAAWCEIQDLLNGGGIHRKVSTIPLPQTTKICWSLL